MAKYDPNEIAKTPQGTFPQNAIAGQEWSRCEPILTPELLTQRFLFGIPLVSQVVNPMTKRPDVKTPEVLKDHIYRAISSLEAELGIYIFPIQFEDEMPFDRTHLEQYTYIRTKNKPVLSVDHLAIRPQNNERAQDIYIMPPEWLSITNANKGQINVVPLVTADSQTFPQAVTGHGALFLLSYVNKLPWAPSYWQIRYTAGFPEAKVPGVLNELIGIQAAMDILSDVGATYRIQSYSLGLDGLSQSQATPGPQVYKTRIEELTIKKKTLLQRMKSMFGTKLAMGTI
jgi:hypothetical protein